jgi:predicted PurR-regulated permease PerM
MLVALFIIFIFVVVAFLYIIKFLMSLSNSANIIQGILKKNEKNIDSTLKDIPRITNELTDLSKSTNTQMGKINKILDNVNDTTEIAVDTTKVVKDGVLNKVRNIYDIIYLLMKVFFHDEKNEQKKS